MVHAVNEVTDAINRYAKGGLELSVLLNLIYQFSVSYTGGVIDEETSREINKDIDELTLPITTKEDLGIVCLIMMVIVRDYRVHNIMVAPPSLREQLHDGYTSLIDAIGRVVPMGIAHTMENILVLDMEITGAEIDLLDYKINEVKAIPANLFHRITIRTLINRTEIEVGIAKKSLSHEKKIFEKLKGVVEIRKHIEDIRDKIKHSITTINELDRGIKNIWGGTLSDLVNVDDETINKSIKSRARLKYKYGILKDAICAYIDAKYDNSCKEYHHLIPGIIVSIRKSNDLDTIIENHIGDR